MAPVLQQRPVYPCKIYQKYTNLAYRHSYFLVVRPVVDFRKSFQPERDMDKLCIFVYFRIQTCLKSEILIQTTRT